MRLNIVVGQRVRTAAALAVMLGILGMSAACGEKKPVTSNLTNATAPTLQHASQDVLQGPFIVEPGAFKSYKIDVVPGMSKPVIQGSFTASGGNNDIEVFVLEASQFLNWQNGHKADVTFSSGRVTANKLNIPLPEGSGTYYVVFSNRFSYITNKAVTADIQLAYDHRS